MCYKSTNFQIRQGTTEENQILIKQVFTIKYQKIAVLVHEMCTKIIYTKNEIIQQNNSLVQQELLILLLI